MLHVLKCWPEPFQAIVRGEKRHEIRKNDRGYAAGDMLRLEEWDPTSGTYTGGTLVVLVTYMTTGGSWGIPDELCVMSINRPPLACGVCGLAPEHPICAVHRYGNHKTPVCEPLPEAPRTEEATCTCHLGSNSPRPCPVTHTAGSEEATEPARWKCRKCGTVPQWPGRDGVQYFLCLRCGASCEDPAACASSGEPGWECSFVAAGSEAQREKGEANG